MPICWSNVTFYLLEHNVSQTASHEITLVCTFVHPSQSFLKIGLLVFCDYLHDDSWPWYVVTDQAKFLKKNLQPDFGPKGPKLGLKWGLCNFFVFWSLVFLEITYSDSLQQCLTSSRGKYHEKNFWGLNLGQTSQNSS